MRIHIPPGDLDPILRVNRRPGTVFVLAEGEYWTQGGFSYEAQDACVLAPECSLVGAGSACSIIRARNVDSTFGSKPAQYAEILTGGARTSGHSAAMRLEDFTLDCTECPTPSVGIHLWTSRATVRGVNVRGLWGSRELARESFGILINNAAQPAIVDGGHLVEDCWVTTKATTSENYITAVYVGCVHREGSALARSTVRRVVTVASSAAHAAFGVNDNTALYDCEAHGFNRAIFCDTDSGQDVVVSNFHAENCAWALHFSTTGGHSRSRFTLQDSTFIFRQGTDWSQAVLLEATNGSSMTDIVLKRCRFVAGGRLASKGRCNGLGINPVTEQDCEWIAHSADDPWQIPVLQSGASPWCVLTPRAG